jgi:hypothetical protein
MTKPIAPDDLRKGMWIIITARRPPKIQVNGPDGDTIQLPNIIPIHIEEPTGVPIKIHAVSLPFVVGFPALAPYQLTTIYITDKVIRKPTQQYVNVFTNHFILMQETTQLLRD